MSTIRRRARGPRGRRLVPAAIATAVMVMATDPASAATLEPVLNDPGVPEYGAAASPGYLVWTSSVHVGADPDGFDLVEPRGYLVHDGEPAVLLSDKITPSVSIDGTTAVFERVFIGRNHGWWRSDLRFYDVETGEVSLPPEGVNTREWEEVNPSIAGDWLLFTRTTQFDIELPRYQVVLFNLVTLEERVLASHKTRNLFAGQVNGDWATWESCDIYLEPFPDGLGWIGHSLNCQVHRYRISTGERELLPNPGRQQYGVAVAHDGTIYFVRGGRRDEWRCGINTRIVRVLPDGTSDVIAVLPDVFDSGHLFALEEPDGLTTLYLDYSDCDSYSHDVYRLTVPPVEASSQGRAR